MKTMQKWLWGFMVLGLGAVAHGQGSESFENSTATTTYANGSFVGDEGFQWSYVHARNEGDYPVDGKGIMLRRSDEPSSLSATITGGIGNFSVDTRKAFTGNTQRRLELVINGSVVAQHEPAFADGADATVIPFMVNDINTPGNVNLTLRLYGATGNQQITLDNISWTGFASTDPLLFASVASLSDFRYSEDMGPSPVESYTLSGENLDGAGNILITAPANFEISLTSDTGFGSFLNIPFQDDAIIDQPVTIYVRLEAGLVEGTYSGNITHSGGGVASPPSVSLSGTVTPPPPGGSLVYYTFEGNAHAPFFVAPDVTASNFDVVPGTVGFAWANSATWIALDAEEPYAISSQNWTGSSQGDTKYFFFNMETLNDQAVSITNISFIHRRTDAGPQNTGISINGVSVYSASLAANSTEFLSLPVVGFMNQTSVVIRIEGWNASGTGSYQVDNVLVQGTVDDFIESTVSPTVSAPTVSDIVGGSATLGGTIDAEGDATVVERGIFWSLDMGFDPATGGTKVGELGTFSTGAFTIPVTGLPPVTTIYFVAFARNAAGYGLSGESEFTTGTMAPVVESPSAAGNTETTVTLSADITSTGGLNVDERGFVYSTVQGFNPVTEGTSLFEDDGNYGAGGFSLPLTDLTPDTQYFFVAYANNATGTGYSAESSFRTLAPPPPGALAFYTFTGSNAAPQAVAAGLSATDLAVSSGSISFGWVGSQAAAWEALGGESPYAQSGEGWNEADQNSAKNFFVTITADEGVMMTITNVSFLQRRTSAGPSSTGVRIDDVSMYSDTLADATVVAVSIPVAGYADVTNAVISIDGWGETTGAGDLRIDNILIQGTVEIEGPPPVDPEPAVIAFFGPTETPGYLGATFVAAAGVTYRLEFTTDLTADPVVWVFVDDVLGVGVEETLQDDDPAAPLRIYRVVAE